MLSFSFIRIGLLFFMLGMSYGFIPVAAAQGQRAEDRTLVDWKYRVGDHPKAA
ncbi:MAG TPA: hypothetical protein VE954_00750 [Oligoflexus sp.]|uniref:hypothetical protein n=1 Tax=Oligoflexus sp. TaxID=1971216 RepID=UPI002D23ABCB|nr:hypothetical protein [Oligoflexus sp.]HYX31608.1 hypothetical protein [Oligoflexus sp.]